MQSSNGNNKKNLTPRQILALEYWKKDKLRNKARALRKAGYSEAIARQPHKFFNSPAIKEELYLLGLGDRISRYQREQKVPLKEWEQEQRRQEEERERKERIIKQITPDQIFALRERLIEVGYNPHFDPNKPVIDTYSQPTSQDAGDVFEIFPKEKTRTDMLSFSSM